MSRSRLSVLYADLLGLPPIRRRPAIASPGSREHGAGRPRPSRAQQGQEGDDARLASWEVTLRLRRRKGLGSRVAH